MFGFFKRTKIADFEVDLLRNVIKKLPTQYSYLIKQINDGLFKGVLMDVSDIPGYVAFTYHPNIEKKYGKKKEPDFKFSNIKVFDSKLLSFAFYELYISSGTISGYSLVGGNVKNLDLNKIDVLGLRKEFIGEADYNRIMHIFNQEEVKLINPSEVYSVFIGDREYFHLKDLEDGDFIGVDENKVVYKITQDPLQEVIVNVKLLEILNIP